MPHPANPKRNVLVVYYSNSTPLRTTLRDHLYSFPRHSEHNFFYLNLAVRRFPWYLKTIPVHLVIFHTLFLSMRGSTTTFDRVTKKVAFLKKSGATKVAIPQDDFIHSDQLCAFLNEFGVEYVFSAAPETEWPKIYDQVDLERVQFIRVLTGYLSDETVVRIGRLANKVASRDIAIGYRTQRLSPSTGRHGQLRGDLADVFKKKAPAKGLVTDISTRNKDILLGDKWYEFLLKCKYTIGVEGGTSLLDRSGAIKDRTERYLALHPNASFEDVESACFSDLDGALSVFVITPRHLEACATRTCQVLVEGRYNGILSPGEHYIELKRDFSNLDEVLDTIKRDDQRERITERAYQDVVQSGKFTYQTFVDGVIGTSLRTTHISEAEVVSQKWDNVVNLWARIADRLSWSVVALLSAPRNVLRRLLSEEGFNTLSGWKRRLIRR